jgi:flagellar protein FlaI
MTGSKNPNLIYPAEGNIFIHILANPEDIRDYYIPVEPSVSEDLDALLNEVEEHLVDSIEDLGDISDGPKRIEAILGLVDKIITVRSDGGRQSGHDGRSAKQSPQRGKRKRGSKTIVTPTQYQALRYLLRRNLEGLEALDPMIQDIYIEDISCPGLGNIFVEHKIFGGLRTIIGFDTHAKLDRFVIRLAERIRHPVTFRDPCVDATLPDGSRINIVYGTDVSKRGSNFTIRKFSLVPLSIIDLIAGGALNYEMGAYLSLIIQEEMSIFVSGETASGKTTLMNAITTFITPESKIVSIEDTPEVQVPHPNWIRGVTRGSTKGSQASEVSMFDLLKAALRQRPNMIIIGEIRGAEGAIAFQAMQTGHACMSTFHASTVTKLIQRLTGDPINIPKAYVDNLNVVIIAQMVRLPNGLPGRRVTSINEIVGYDSVANTFSFIEVFSWKPEDDTFFFKGHMNSYLLEEKIAPRRGIPHEKRQQIYSQIRQRAEVLKRIQGQKITNFYAVYGILSKAYREGYFR